MLRIILILSFLFNFFYLFAQNVEFRFGLIDKLEFNRLKIENSNNKTEIIYENGMPNAFGLYVARNIGKHSFLDASGLISSAKYTVNFVRSGSKFIDANIHFAQINLNLNLVINPNSNIVNVYIFGGGQLLYRISGEERYTNGVIAKTYWPKARLFAQAGLGVKCNISNGFYLQPFAGFRYAVEQQLVYDVSLNQLFAGAVFCYGIKDKPKDRYKKCPAEF